jgi:hypothetical protein
MLYRFVFPVLLLTFLLASHLSFAEVVKFEQSSRVQVGRLAVYKLEGTPRAIGRAAAVLAPQTILNDDKGMIPYMSNYVKNLILHQEVMQNSPVLRALIPTFLNLKYYWSLRSRILPEYKEYIEGLAESSGFSVDALTRAFLNPDVVQAVVADVVTNRILPFNLLKPQAQNVDSLLQQYSNFACTSFAVPGKMTKDGKMLFGRVQDYGVAGVYDMAPSLYYIVKPGKHRYVLVSTAGIAVGGITAMNEHGFVLSWHSGLTTETEVSNYPGMITTTRMVEEAKTIEEAAAICSQNVPVSGWIMNLADVKDGKTRTAWIEVEPILKKCTLSWGEPGEVFVSTNHYRTENAKKKEIFAGPSYNGSSEDRMQRVRNYFKTNFIETKKKVGVEDVMRLLGDRWDPKARRYTAYSPSSIAAVDQIVSVVFIPETREMYVSDGITPPSGKGTYRRFSFAELDNIDLLAKNEAMRSKDVDADKVLNENASNLSNYAGFNAYIEASKSLDIYSAFDIDRAIENLSLAVEAEPKEPLLRALRALTYMSEGRAEAALKDWDIVLMQGKLLDAHRALAYRIQRAKTLDALGKRQEALIDYAFVLSAKGAYKGLVSAAQKFSEHAATLDDVRRVNPSVKFIDTVSYD